MYLFFDTETTGTENWNYHVLDLKHWPRLIQLGFLLFDEKENEIMRNCKIIKPTDYIIPEDATEIHGITTERALKEGVPLITILREFSTEIKKSKILVGHNIDFDICVIAAEYQRTKLNHSLFNKNKFCTMKNQSIIDYCKLSSSYVTGKYKWPCLSELYYKLFGDVFEEAHDALKDAETCAKCFFEIKKRGIIQVREY